MTIPFLPRQDAIPPTEGSWYDGNSPLQLKQLRSADEKQAVMLLRARAYSAAGYDFDDAAQTLDQQIDGLATTILFGAMDGARLVGAVRLSFSLADQSLKNLPCTAFFPELQQFRGERLVEVSRLSLEPELANLSYRTTLYAFLVRTAFAAAKAMEVDKLIIAAKPEFVIFYKYMLGFTPIGTPQLYPPGDIKITLFAGSLKQADERQRRQNRFFKVSDSEVTAMRNQLELVMRPSI